MYCSQANWAPSIDYSPLSALSSSLNEGTDICQVLQYNLAGGLLSMMVLRQEPLRCVHE